jgi:hypothetical protein
MPRVVFELTIPVFERAKTVHAFDRAAKVIGLFCPIVINSYPLLPYFLSSVSFHPVSHSFVPTYLLYGPNTVNVVI